MIENSPARPRQYRTTASVITAFALGSGVAACAPQPHEQTKCGVDLGAEVIRVATQDVERCLGSLAIKGRAPKTGYTRSKFGDGWQQHGGCDTRNEVLARDLTDEKLAPDGCKVISGTLKSEYTGLTIRFVRGTQTSDDVQIDHRVSLSDAWQTGAQQLPLAKRVEFANDGLNLEAVEGSINQQKGDGDAATWLPPNKLDRCDYITHQVLVKAKYNLWVKPAEHNAMENVLESCPDQTFTLEASLR